MPTLTVKNIPNDVYERLKQKLKPTGAVLTARSSLATNILSAAKLSNRNKSLWASARRIREKTSQYIVSNEEFNQAKNIGRQ